MDPEKALQFIVRLIDPISGFTPPQVRQMDQAFQSLAEVVVRDKAAQEAHKDDGKKGGKS